MQSNESESTTPAFLKKVAAKVFRGFLWLVVLLALLGAAAYAYYLYEEYSELTYMTSDSCVKHNAGTQLCEENDGGLYLRRIEPQNNRLSVSYLYDDPEEDSYSYNYRSFWFDECTDGLEIETDRLYSDGNHFTLTCSTQAERFLSSSAPSRLRVGFGRSIKSDVTMDSNGFKIDHAYSYADYSPLQRRLALTNTSVIEQRKARQEREEQARLAKEAEQLRLAAEKKRAAIQVCNIKIESARKEFDRVIEASRRLVLDTKDSVTHECETSRNSNWCDRYIFTIRNPTKIPIKMVTIGYDSFLVCEDKPTRSARTEILTVNLEPDEEYESLIEWATNGPPTCSKVLDVEFDKTFIPEQC